MAPSRTSPRHIAPSLDPTRIHIKDTLRFTSFTSFRVISFSRALLGLLPPASVPLAAPCSNAKRNQDREDQTPLLRAAGDAKPRAPKILKT